MLQNCRSRLQRGISLLECVCAVVIVGTSLVAGYSLYSMQEQVYATTRATQKGLAFLRRELEITQATPFDALASSGGFVAVDDDPGYELQSVITNAGVYLKRAAISVRWTTPTGTVHTQTADTFCYDRRNE